MYETKQAGMTQVAAPLKAQKVRKHFEASSKNLSGKKSQSHSAEITWKRDPLGFKMFFLSKNIKEGDTFRTFCFRKKSHSSENKTKIHFNLNKNVKIRTGDHSDQFVDLKKSLL